MRSAWIGLGLLVLGLGCSVEPPAPKGELAPAFELEMLSGGTISLDDFQGRMVLIDFWATWCPPCVREIPELNAFYAAHRANGVELVAISVDMVGREFLEDWTVEKGVLYPVAFGDIDLALTYGIENFPYHLLVGPDGRILERLNPGYHDREELRELLARHEESQLEG